MGKKLGLWLGVIAILVLVIGNITYAQGKSEGKGRQKGVGPSDNPPGMKGDNRDDLKSGKVDRLGDGNSGQGDDLHKKCKQKPSHRKGDNKDDLKSGKIDKFGDGNSGQGDDWHKKFKGKKPPHQLPPKVKEFLKRKFEDGCKGEDFEDIIDKIKERIGKCKKEYGCGGCERCERLIALLEEVLRLLKKQGCYRYFDDESDKKGNCEKPQPPKFDKKCRPYSPTEPLEKDDFGSGQKDEDNKKWIPQLRNLERGFGNNRGHGNNLDHDDEDNPGKGKGGHGAKPGYNDDGFDDDELGGGKGKGKGKGKK